MAKDKLLLSRGEVVLRSGVSAPDSVFLTFVCPRCGRFLDERLERPATAASPRDLKSLIASAQAQAAKELGGAAAGPACDHCELPGTAISLDYHTFRGPAAAGRDLVVRCFRKKGIFGRGRHELLWCDLSTHETLPVEELEHAHRALATEVREERPVVVPVLPIEMAEASDPGDYTDPTDHDTIPDVNRRWTDGALA